MLLEGTLMGTALDGVLAVDERVVLLTVLVGMGEGDFNVLTLQVDNGIEGIAGHTVLQQIFQTMTGDDATAIIHDGQARVQVSIVAEHILHDLIVVGVVLEEGIVWFEEDVCAVLILRRFRDIANQFATLEDGLSHLAVTITAHLEMAAQGIDGLDTHAIQADRLLECLGVELTAGIQDANGVDEFPLGDASAVVAHRHPQIVLDGHLDTVASLHLELVDGVVEHFLQQHIDAVVGLRAVIEFSNIHTRTQADMFQSRQGDNIGVVILHLTVRLILNAIVFSFHKSIDILCKGTIKK